MRRFATPEPITAVIESVAGTVHVIASDRDDTVVEVRPHNPQRSSDVRAAEQARVDYGNGTLRVIAGPRILSLGRGGAVDIDIAVPTGSRLDASSASAQFIADGRYADCRFATASGDVLIGEVHGNLKADTSSGDLTAKSVVGNGRIATASGDARIDRLDGEVKFQAASGGLTIGRLHGHATAQTASGSAAVATAVNGALSVQTSSGTVDVGIPQGTVARLELNTRTGTVSNALDGSDGPDDGDETVIVNARTGSGDISVWRAPGPSAA